jgi:hypothetical protein
MLLRWLMRLLLMDCRYTYIHTYIHMHTYIHTYLLLMDCRYVSCAFDAWLPVRVRVRVRVRVVRVRSACKWYV